MTLARLRNYYRDEMNDDANGNNDAGICRINNNKIVANKSFEYEVYQLIKIRQPQKLLFHYYI